MASPAQSDSLDANHDRLIISIVAVFSVLACLALTSRLVSKRLKKAGLGYDDYMAIGAWVFLDMLALKLVTEFYARSSRYRRVY